ncbi:hypothetical protein DFH06DRAFT_1169601 [Mycena polygramma]|nr:hypothetical protein DFH06DRAFT_1169601 [Mycena polygramma]
MEETESLRQVDGLWFSNDTLVLRAENSIFRVSKSMLAARSSVFESMIEFPPSTADGDQMMDGSPVVRLHDSASEVEAFLRAIFDSSYFMPPPAEVDFHVVLGILRLSHKYDVAYLHTRALAHLERVYPLDHTIYSTLTTVTQPHQRMSLGFHLTAVPVLIEVDATWLLPSAYYAIGTYELSTLRTAGAPWDALPPSIREACLPLAGIQLKAAIRISRFISDESVCASSTDCAEGRLTVITSMITRLDSPLQDPLAEWNNTEWERLRNVLCSDCVCDCQVDHSIALLEVWNALPGNCGLEDWDVLLAKRQAVMG